MTAGERTDHLRRRHDSARRQPARHAGPRGRYASRSSCSRPSTSSPTGRCPRRSPSAPRSRAGRQGRIRRVAGLVGMPGRSAPPGLARLSDRRHRLRRRLPPVERHRDGAHPGDFPAAFSGLDLGPVRLRRSPVTLGITTSQLDAQNRPQPLAGADREHLAGLAPHGRPQWSRRSERHDRLPARRVPGLAGRDGPGQRQPVRRGRTGAPTDPRRRSGRRSLDVDGLGALRRGRSGRTRPGRPRPSRVPGRRPAAGSTDTASPAIST